MTDWLAAGRVFIYDVIGYEAKRFKLMRKLAPAVMPELQKCELTIDSRVKGVSTSGSLELTEKRLEHATHFMSPAGGFESDDTAEMIFPRKRFAQLAKTAAVPWTTGWGEGAKVKLERFDAKPFKLKIDGVATTLPAIGARGGNLTLLILDDPTFPLVLELREDPYPEKLLEIVSPKARKPTTKKPAKKPAKR